MASPGSGGAWRQSTGCPGVQAQHLLQLLVDIVAIPARAFRNLRRGDAAGTIVVGGNRKVQVVFIGLKEFTEVAGSRINISAGIIEIGLAVYAEVLTRGRPLDLHQSDGILVGACRGVEVAFPAGDCQQQGLR